MANPLDPDFVAGPWLVERRQHFMIPVKDQTLKNGVARIPQGFWVSNRSTIGSELLTMGCDKKIFRIGVGRSGGQGYLTDQLIAFCKHYSVKAGQIVCFRRDGKRRFTTLVFDECWNQRQYKISSKQTIENTSGDDTTPNSNKRESEKFVSVKRKDKTVVPAEKKRKTIGAYVGSTSRIGLLSSQQTSHTNTAQKTATPKRDNMKLAKAVAAAKNKDKGAKTTDTKRKTKKKSVETPLCPDASQLAQGATNEPNVKLSVTILTNDEEKGKSVFVVGLPAYIKKRPQLEISIGRIPLLAKYGTLKWNFVYKGKIWPVLIKLDPKKKRYIFADGWANFCKQTEIKAGAYVEFEMNYNHAEPKMNLTLK